MENKNLNAFDQKKLSSFGMRTIAGGEDTVDLQTPPKKVFPVSSSATHIKQDTEGDLNDIYILEDPLLP